MDPSLIFMFFFMPFFVNCKDDEDGVKFATKCEVCKITSFELEEKLRVTRKSHQVIESCYSLDACNKKTKYRVSQTRLEDSLDELCERMLQYNIHKERTDSTRFAKGMSQTFETLHGLVAKGVKVDLGIPFELWNNTSAEISNLKSQCESLLEDHEEDITNWFFKHQETVDLRTYLCKDKYLKDSDATCLTEPMGLPTSAGATA
ncbi:protein canopy homolog 3-like [Artemia franciscana]|uniref:DUF3456 domain-containing protein n=1 Tax=Artemia franciscana TaxID=6661 RepID=A0AA88ISI0_ARTSF|nr:hypothetical protein QYM36_007616 [Artemia franciscana]